MYLIVMIFFMFIFLLISYSTIDYRLAEDEGNGLYPLVDPKWDSEAVDNCLWNKTSLEQFELLG